MLWLWICGHKKDNLLSIRWELGLELSLDSWLLSTFHRLMVTFLANEQLSFGPYQITLLGDRGLCLWTVNSKLAKCLYMAINQDVELTVCQLRESDDSLATDYQACHCDAPSDTLPEAFIEHTMLPIYYRILFSFISVACQHSYCFKIAICPRPSVHHIAVLYIHECTHCQTCSIVR